MGGWRALHERAGNCIEPQPEGLWLGTIPGPGMQIPGGSVGCRVSHRQSEMVGQFAKAPTSGLGTKRGNGNPRIMGLSVVLHCINYGDGHESRVQTKPCWLLCPLLPPARLGHDCAYVVVVTTLPLWWCRYGDDVGTYGCSVPGNDNDATTTSAVRTDR